MRPFLPAKLLVLATLLAVLGAQQDVIRVDVSSEKLSPALHAWAIVDGAMFMQHAGHNFSCSDAHAWSMLMYAGSDSKVVPFSYGCWGSMLETTGSAAAMVGPAAKGMPEGCHSAAPERSIFLRRERTYTVCGLSFWNNFFGGEGAVSLSVAETDETLVAYSSADALQANRNGCLLYTSPSPRDS